MTQAKYFTTDDLATRFQASPSTIRYWRHIGKGPGSFRIGRRVLYAIEDVEAYEAALMAGASEPTVERTMRHLSVADQLADLQRRVAEIERKLTN